MTGDERIESARAAQEARESVARRDARGPRGVQDAMTRYLASESFHERRREEEERKDEALAEDEDEE